MPDFEEIYVVHPELEGGTFIPESALYQYGLAGWVKADPPTERDRKGVVPGVGVVLEDGTVRTAEEHAAIVKKEAEEAYSKATEQSGESDDESGKTDAEGNKPKPRKRASSNKEG